MMEQHIIIDDIKIPLLGYGTWDLKGNTCVEGVKDALNMGYRHIDTARMYGNEAEVGEGISKSGVKREDIYLVTKIAPSELNPERIPSVTENSLKKLGTDFVDLLLIHWPSPNMDLEGVLGAMKKLQEKGKIRQLGVSNFSPELVEQSLNVTRVVCNQVEFNPYKLQHENLKKVKEKNMFLTAYTPIAKGKVFKDKTISEIAGTHNKTEAQVTLRWLLQHGRVSVIPKAAGAEHRKSNMEIFDFELSEDEMHAVASAS